MQTPYTVDMAFVLQTSITKYSIFKVANCSVVKFFLKDIHFT